MRRFTTVLTGVAVAVFLPIGASAAPPIVSTTTQFTTGGITVTGPLDGANIEVAGPKTTAVTITAPAATFTNANAVTIDVVVFIRDANGVVEAKQVFPSVLGGTTSDGTGGLAKTINFSLSTTPAFLGTNLATAIGTARSLVNLGATVSGGGTATAFGIGIVVNDTTVDGADGAETLLDLTSETNDTIIDADDAGPQLTQVFRDTTGSRMIFVFDDNISTSVLGSLTNADFEFSATSTGGFSGFAALDFTGNPTIIPSSNNRAMEFTIDAGTTPSIGQFVRIALPDTGGTENVDLQDLALNPTDAQPAIQVGSVPTFAITGAEWTDTIATGATEPDVLRVDFNADLNSGVLGDAVFWRNVVSGLPTSIVPSSGTTDLTVTTTPPTTDPNFPSSVFLEVVSGGTDSLAADGKDDNTGGLTPRTFNLSVDSTNGIQPQNFLATPLTGAPNVPIGDEIQPAVIGNPFTLDTDGDGMIDAFGWDFTEPIDVTGASATGFTLTKDTTGNPVHPFDLFQANLGTTLDPTATVNQDTIVLDTTVPIDNTFPAASFGVQSEDPTGLNRLQQNNVLVMNFDPAAVDWDEDGTVGPLDVDQEATPGTFDTDFADIVIDAAMSGVKDANGVLMSLDNGTVMPPVTTSNASLVDDGASPVATRVDFLTGDNITGGNQLPTEQGTAVSDVGDSATNNVASIIFNETMNDPAPPGIEEPQFHFGSGDQKFAQVDFDGANGGIVGNIVTLTDTQGTGFSAGDTFTIDGGPNSPVTTPNGLEDTAGNEYLGTGGSGAPPLTVQDGTAPYIPLVSILDSGGSPILSAFLGGVDTNDFATTLTLTFSRDLKAGTGTTAADWSIEGVGTPATDPVLSGNTLTFTFPTGLVSASSIINVTYKGSTALAANLITANGGTMAPVAPLITTFKARVPTVDVAGEFMATMDISGTITDTDGSTVAPDGTQVFGFIAAPRISSVTFTMGGVDMTIKDAASMKAFTNFFLGLEAHLFLLIDGPFMDFSNDKEAVSGADGIIDIALKTSSSSNVTFSGSGSTTLSASNGSAGASLKVTGGKATVVWDVLRSNVGTAFDLFSNGYKIGGKPIASKAIVTKGDGTYILHMTAPISAFNSALNAIGWPVIIVVEHTNGTRYAVSGLLDAIDLLGPITFQALNRLNGPINSDANIPFDVDLSMIASRSLFQGWNGLGDDRDSGWQSAAKGVLLPEGVTNITTGTTLNNVNAMDQFVYFLDNGDGKWTSADDSSATSRFDSITVSTGGLPNSLVFTMTDKGVKVGNDVKAFTGGYAAGFFNGNAKTVGVFQFGPAISTTTNQLFSTTGPFPNNKTTLGWSFVTAPSTTTNPAGFLTDNASDFFILFNRTANKAVDIKTFSTSGGDATKINQGDTLFVHKP